MARVSLSPEIIPSAAAGALAWAHPLVREWFLAKFGSATEPQEQGWPHILAGHTTLIAAPTGSGKTLAAFLACIDRLVTKALSGALGDRTEVLYISPLKALGNDIAQNLEKPLGEIMLMAHARGLLMPQIRTFVRTGDTPASDRQRMLKRPPHILVTTPESLYILLTSEKSREVLRHVETVIVDEIHAIADDKRGSHLSLSLERLDALSGRPAVRIGLSATQKPIEVVAQFLTGNGKDVHTEIVNVGHRRRLDLAVEVPPLPLGPVTSNDHWDATFDRIVQLVETHRSTLVFVNTRAQAERVAHDLGQRLGDENVAAHHGSLSRKLRLMAEQKLRAGEIKVLVATASLELGIDIGFIDLVCHISSPRSIAVLLQRIGRAGHWRGAIPKGRVFPLTLDELVECATLVRTIERGELDRLIIPDSPLDILAQQMVAACAAEEWQEDDLFTLARRAYPYRNLSRQEFDEVLTMLTEGVTASRGRYGAYLHRDRVNGRVKARRGSRMIAILNGGAIPETSLFSVLLQPEQVQVGTLHEDFAVEVSRGDIVLLGNTSWRIQRVESAGRVLVEDAHGAPPTLPFWLGEAPGRTHELSREIGELRQEVADRTAGVKPGVITQHEPQVAETVAWLKSECHLDDSAAEQIVEYVVTGRTVLGAVPTQKRIIAERFFDEGGGMQLVIHAPFGARVNKAWGLSLRKRFCRSFNFELQAAATDNGLNISLAEQHSFPLADVFEFLHESSVQSVLEQAALDSPIFGTRWRWDAERSLALLRYRNGKKLPPQVQRTRSDDLLASVFPSVAACQENIEGDREIPNHPIVREVMKDVLTEAMDLEGLKSLLRGMADGSIETVAVDTPIPSVFSHEILNANPFAYLDDAPLEERRARAVEMRRVLPSSVLEEVGKLDPAAIAEVRESAWPDIRDADELADVLMTLVALPEDLDGLGRMNPPEVWAGFLARLREARRATRATVFVASTSGESAGSGIEEAAFWVSADRAASFRAIYPEARLEDELPQIEAEVARSEAVFALITGWMQHAGPVTASLLASLLKVPLNEVDQALLRIEATGSILRGKFEGFGQGLVEWCERRLLARIHRLTLGALRKQIEPVPPATYMRWLFRWQHLAPMSQTAGEHGLLEVLRQLQGFEIPANAWERHVLARRVANYNPEHLDRLSLTGAIGWGRLSPHPATLEASSTGVRRVVPTSVAPITFYVREDADWMMPHHERKDATASKELERSLSEAARSVHTFLTTRGASFFADVVRGTGKLKAEVETGLWELVAAGLVTADGFDNLRALIDPRRRTGRGSQRSARPRHSAGRWSLLYTDSGLARERQIEATCRMLLKRYGIVFRELLVRESVLPKWRELLIAFRRLEDRGEIRGGRFVSGFLGEQFALPEAVESLRELRKIPPRGEEIAVSAADPLNLVGIVVPGDRVPAISGRFVNFRDGVALEGDAAAPVVPIAQAEESVG